MAKVAGRVPTQVFGRAVCDIVGLDPALVRSFTLRVAVDEGVTLEVQMMPSFEPEKMAAGLDGAFRRFVVIEAPDEQEATHGD